MSIGSNLGDRQAALSHAVAALAGMPGITEVRVSPVYETDPVGGVAQPDFLNVVAIADHDGSDASAVATQLLALARTVEADLERIRTVRWGPRTVDVDVLAVGDVVSDDPELTVPHPSIAERAFVLVPWADVDPGFPIPGHGTVAELLTRLSPGDVAGVRRTPAIIAVGPNPFTVDE